VRMGEVRLEYLTRAGRLERLAGPLPLRDSLVGLAPFGSGPPISRPASSVEAGLRLSAAESGLRLVRLTVELEGVNLRDRFLANGFQSWSETRLLGPDDRLPGLRLLGFLRPYGDYDWVAYDGRPGRFHSHWLTYTVDGGSPAPGRNTAGECARGVTFLGSLNEANAYTVFRADYRAGRLWAEIDVDGWAPSPGDVLAHLFWAEAAAGEGYPLPGARPSAAAESPLLPLVRAYAARLAEVTRSELGRGAPDWAPGTLVPRLPHRPGGWNSWYNYYTRVTANDILSEAESLRSAGLPLDFVQIDDGWQAAVGDWLELSPRFAGAAPAGGPASPATRAPTALKGPVANQVMKALVSAIRGQGFEPGLWVAPFAAIRQSETHARGWTRPWKAGWNPGWGSSIYPLDLSRPEVTDYVRRVGEAIHEWGFGLVKADFLYTAALRPWGGRTRAQRMREAMRLLREVAPGRLLACGAPLASAAGLCDYNRLGADTAPVWESGLLSFCRYRERVSNLGALRTVLGRWFMNGTLFVLDPDVFILGKSHLTPAQRRTLYEVTTTVGGMQSFSDSVAGLDPETRTLLARTFPLPPLEVRAVSEEWPDFFAVRVGRPAPSGTPTPASVLGVNLSPRTQGGLAPHDAHWG
jgi:hypothetical protein